MTGRINKKFSKNYVYHKVYQLSQTPFMGVSEFHVQ